MAWDSTNPAYNAWSSWYQNNRWDTSDPRNPSNAGYGAWLQSQPGYSSPIQAPTYGSDQYGQLTLNGSPSTDSHLINPTPQLQAINPQLPSVFTQPQTTPTQQSSPALNALQGIFSSANNLIQQPQSGGNMPSIPGLSTNTMTPLPLPPSGSPMVQSLQNYGNQNNQAPDLSGILQPIQQQIGLTNQQGQQTLSNYLSQRGQQAQQLQGDLMNTLNAGMTSSIPGIEDRLQQLGIAQSGAYPEALARQRANLLASNVLPAMQQFDTNTFDTASGLPLQTAQQVQGLETGSLGRQFGLQDQATQMNFMQSLADKQVQQQQLASILKLVPDLLGTGGLPALMNAQTNANATNNLFGSGTSGLLGNGGLSSLLGSAGGGALGSYLGGQFGGGTGSGIGGALAAYLGGGGLTGALGAGLGGAFGGPGWAAVGGGLGSELPNLLPDITYDPSGNVTNPGGLSGLWQNLFGSEPTIPDMNGAGVTLDPYGLPSLSDMAGSGVLSDATDPDWLYNLFSRK